MAKLYATAVITMEDFGLAAKALSRLEADESTSDWSQHVERSYKCAFEMVFNEFYENQIKVKHLLGRYLLLPDPIGKAWCDWTLLNNARFGTASLHISFNFDNLYLNLDDPDCPHVQAAASYLATVYQLNESSRPPAKGLESIAEHLRSLSRGRHHALGVSRYIYVPVLTDDGVDLRAPSDAVKVNIYRLMYLHSRGVDVATTRSLPTPWGSTAFFRLYSQPGCVLSIATRYPESRGPDAAWFEPQGLPALPCAPLGLGGSGKRLSADGRYTQYDLLAEYPPLRYLALPFTEYAATHEETLRAVQEDAFAGWFEWLVRARWFPGRRDSAVTHLMAANLEGLRLPITRNYVNQMLELQLQSRTARAAMDRLQLRYSRRGILIALIGIFITVVVSDYDKIALNGKILVNWLKADLNLPTRGKDTLPPPGVPASSSK